MRRSKLLILLFLCLYIRVDAQEEILEKRITVNFKNVPLQKVLRELEEKNNIYFSYSSNVVPLEESITISRKNKALKLVLDEIFKKVDVDYQLMDNQFVLKKTAKKKISYSTSPGNLSAGVNTSLQLDSVHKRKVFILNDSVKALKAEVEKLNRVIDSLSRSLEKPKEQVTISDTIYNKTIMERLRLEMYLLNDKLNGLLLKLKKEEQTSDTVTNHEPTYYYIIFNSVPPNFKYPLIGYINYARGKYNGFSLGFLNTVKGEFEGGQIGFVNLVNGNSNGVTLGFANANNGDAYGTQVGFVNLNRGDYVGMRISYLNGNFGNFEGLDYGFVNYTYLNFKGARFGFVNLTNGNERGAVFGYVNLNKGNFKGARFGYLNMSFGESRGFNAAFLNIARKMSGVHIGFINICDSVKSGIPIAFLTIARKNGYRSFEIGSSEALHGQASFKIGVKKFYTIFSAVANFSGQFRWGYGVGIGTLFDLKPSISSINIDALAYNIHEKGANFDDDIFNMLYSLKAYYSHKISGKLSFYAGPAFNIMVSNLHKADNTYGSDIAPWTVFNQTDNQTNIKMWPGFNAGIRF